MKNLIAIAALAAIVLTSCQFNSTKETTTTDSTAVDSTIVAADSTHLTVDTTATK